MHRRVEFDRRFEVGRRPAAVGQPEFTTRCLRMGPGPQRTKPPQHIGPRQQCQVPESPDTQPPENIDELSGRTGIGGTTSASAPKLANTPEAQQLDRQRREEVRTAPRRHHNHLLALLSNPFSRNPFSSDPFSCNPFSSDPFSCNPFSSDPSSCNPFSSDPSSKTGIGGADVDRRCGWPHRRWICAHQRCHHLGDHRRHVPAHRFVAPEVSRGPSRHERTKPRNLDFDARCDVVERGEYRFKRPRFGSGISITNH